MPYRNDCVILRKITGRVALCFMLEEWNGIDPVNVPPPKAHCLQTSVSFAVLVTDEQSLKLQKKQRFSFFCTRISYGAYQVEKGFCYCFGGLMAILCFGGFWILFLISALLNAFPY